jgi:hypothetical protein
MRSDIRPFINIVEAEERHVAALLSLFDRDGFPVPANVTVPDTPAKACRRAVEAEKDKDNMALYDRLLAATQKSKVRRVLQKLQSASCNRHLPAFERWVRRGR